MVCVIFENGPDLPDGEVQTLLKIDKGIRAPDLLRQILPGHHFSRAVDQQRQNSGGLRLKFQDGPVAAQFPRAQVEFKVSETDNGRRRKRAGHGTPPNAIPTALQGIIPELSRSPELLLVGSLITNSDETHACKLTLALQGCINAERVSLGPGTA